LGLFDRLKRIGDVAGGELHPDGLAELQVGEAKYDGWDVVRDFDDLEAGRAWRQQLTDQGIEAVLTADHPVDEWGRGDIALRVPPGKWSQAEELLGEEP
jgi:hypothetical protein